MATRHLKRAPLWISTLMICFLGRCGEEPTTGINSLHFAGDGYLEVANSASLIGMFTGDFSIEIWTAGDTSVPEVARSLIMFGNSNGGNELAIYQGASDSSLVTVYIDDQPFGFYQIPGLDWRRGNWHYLCLTQVNNFVAFYFDGQVIDTRMLGNLAIDIGASNFLIGADYDPPGVNANVGNYWKGYIDEVRLWRRNIQSAEVAYHALHPDKLLQHYSVEDLNSLIGLWRFNTEYSAVVEDESGNGNRAWFKGLLTGFSWSGSGTP